MSNKKSANSKLVKTETSITTRTNRRGFEDVNIKKDLVIPRILLMQYLSPWVTDDESNIQAGEFVSSVTKHKYGKEFKFVPFKFFKTRFLFFSRESGGGIECASRNGRFPEIGLLHSEDCESCPYAQWRKVYEETGYDQIESYYRQDPEAPRDAESKPPKCTEYFSFLGITKEENFPVVLAFGKTSAPAGRDFLNFAYFLGESGDMWENEYTVKSIKREKDDYKWFEIQVSDTVKKTNEQDKKRAEKFYDFLTTKKFDIDMAEEQDIEVNDSKNNQKTNSNDDEKLPF